jgi:hypothetical protein
MRREHFVKVVEENTRLAPTRIPQSHGRLAKQTAGFVVGFKEHGKEV